MNLLFIWTAGKGFTAWCRCIAVCDATENIFRTVHYRLQVRGSLFWVLWGGGFGLGGSALLFVGFSVLVSILPRSL